MSIDGLHFGTPVGVSIRFRVVGQDAAEVRDIMRSGPNAIGMLFDWNEQIKYVRLAVRNDRARVRSHVRRQCACTKCPGPTSVIDARTGS